MRQGLTARLSEASNGSRIDPCIDKPTSRRGGVTFHSFELKAEQSSAVQILRIARLSDRGALLRSKGVP